MDIRRGRRYDENVVTKDRHSSNRHLPNYVINNNNNTLRNENENKPSEVAMTHRLYGHDVRDRHEFTWKL